MSRWGTMKQISIWNEKVTIWGTCTKKMWVYGEDPMEDMSHWLQTRSKSSTFKNFQAALKITCHLKLSSWLPRGPGQLREIHRRPQFGTEENTCPQRQSLGNTSGMAPGQYRAIQWGAVLHYRLYGKPVSCRPVWGRGQLWGTLFI